VAEERAVLRSGLYILAGEPASSSEHGRRTCVIFWPEDTTWSDYASSSTKKDRVAFMRYLTKLTDQLLVFVSPEHAESFVWKNAPAVKDDTSMFEGEDDEDSDDDPFSSDCIFDFTVEKTAEQNEGVSMRPGFEVRSLIPDLTASEPMRSSTTRASSCQWTLTTCPSSFRTLYSERQRRPFSLQSGYQHKLSRIRSKIIPTRLP